MAEAIKKQDIVEGSPFNDIAREIAIASSALEEFDAKVIQLSTHMKKDLTDANVKTLADIEKINKAEIQSEFLLQKKLDTEKKQIQLAEVKRKAMEAEAKAHERAEKQYNKEIQQAEKANSVYAKVDAKLSGMVKTYRDLAIKKELGAKLSAKEQKDMDFLAAKIQKYDSALKSVDATSGKFQRNVGNYKSGFDGMTFSVTQLAREMPAFANSVQTGFMAISNNLPMFFDEIQKLKQANLELIASGEKPKSVFKSLAGSIMSTQVLLSVGVTLLTLYGAKLVEMTSNLFKGNKAMIEFKSMQEKINDNFKEQVKFIAEESAQFVGLFTALSKTNKGSKERAQLMEQINDNYGITLKNISDEAEFQKMLNKEVADYLEYQKKRFIIQKNTDLIQENLKKQFKLESAISKQQERIAKAEAVEAKQKELRRLQEASSQAFVNKNEIERIKINAEIRKLEKEISKERANGVLSVFQETEALNFMNKEYEILNKRLENYGLTIAKNTVDENKYTGAKKQGAKAQKEINTELDYTNDYISRQIELNKELSDLRNQMLLELQQGEINDVFANMMKRVTETGIIEVDALEELIRQKTAMEIQYLADKTNAELNQLEYVYNEEFKMRRASLDAKYRDLLAQDNLTAEKRAEIEANYNKALTELDNEELSRNKDLQAQKQIITDKAKQEVVKIEKEGNDQINDMNEQLIDGQIEYYKTSNDKQREERKKQLEAEKARNKAILEDTIKVQDAITQYLQEQVDKRIANMEREKDHASKMQDYLQNLAEQGNIYAQQSLTEQIQRQRDAQEEIMRLQKQKANIEAISAGLKTFTTELENGKTPASALASTLVNTTVLVNLLKNLSFFAKGTENAPEGLAVVDEQGAELITDKNGNVKQLGSDKGSRFTWLNKGDKVYTATQTASILDVANISKPKGATTESGNIQLLRQSFNELKQAIVNKPESSTDWASFGSGISEIIDRKTANGVTTTNRFRVR